MVRRPRDGAAHRKGGWITRVSAPAAIGALVVVSLASPAGAAVLIEVFGGPDEDIIVYSPFSVIGHTQIWGGGSDDDITLDELPNIELAQKYRDLSGTPASLVTGWETTPGGGVLPLRDFVDVDG